jgi:hypothetical protein
MNDTQMHAIGLYAAVNGLALSRRAARSQEQREVLRERKRERSSRRRMNRASRRGRDAYITVV